MSGLLATVVVEMLLPTLESTSFPIPIVSDKGEGQRAQDEETTFGSGSVANLTSLWVCSCRSEAAAAGIDEEVFLLEEEDDSSLGKGGGNSAVLGALVLLPIFCCSCCLEIKQRSTRRREEDEE